MAIIETLKVQVHKKFLKILNLNSYKFLIYRSCLLTKMKNWTPSNVLMRRKDIFRLSNQIQLLLVFLSECENKHSSDEECDQWFRELECRNNPEWMFTNCWKACTQCAAPDGKLTTLLCENFIDLWTTDQ